MNRSSIGASWAVVVILVVGAGAAFGQSFKPYQYTPSPANNPYGGPPGSGPQDYFRREKEMAQDAERVQSWQAQQKLDKEMSWWKSAGDFQGLSSERLTIGATVLLFAVMGGVVLWASAGSMFRRPSAPPGGRR